MVLVVATDRSGSRHFLALLLLLGALGGAAAGGMGSISLPSDSCFGWPRTLAFRRRRQPLSLPLQVRGGADFADNDAETSPSALSSAPPISSYEIQLEAVKSRVLKKALESVADLRIQIEQGETIEGLGSQADAIVNSALQEFATQAPPEPTDTDSSSGAENSAVYDRTIRTLEASVDAPLHVLYLKQLGMLRDNALQRYRSASKTTSVSDYEAMLQADSQFVSQAQDSTRSGGSAPGGAGTSTTWDYSMERSFLQAVMNNLAESAKRSMDAQVSAAQQSQTAMQFLQSQQQMIQQLQMQLYGQSSPWNVGVAYRIPDTNFNVQGTYQQGRANVQLSCVPDEYAPFLGPNGFTNGVGPGNLGLSLNLSV
jgi:hypothetical protein